PWLPESPRTYSPLSQPRQSLQDVLAPGRRKAIGAVLQVKVAVAPESVPRAGARAALGIPEKDEEVHHRTGRSGRSGQVGPVTQAQRKSSLPRCLPSRLRDELLHTVPASPCIPGSAGQSPRCHACVTKRFRLESSPTPRR